MLNRLKGLLIMRALKASGLADPITLGIVVICFIIGGYFMQRSKAVDHPIEQASEAVLKSLGIDHDFSQAKKDKLKEDEKNKSK